MLDVVIEINQNEEANSLMEDVEVVENEESQSLGPIDGRQSLKKEMTRYYDKQQQLGRASGQGHVWVQMWDPSQYQVFPLHDFD
jgi:hypothetical protein